MACVELKRILENTIKDLKKIRDDLATSIMTNNLNLEHYKSDNALTSYTHFNEDMRCIQSVISKLEIELMTLRLP